jgi:chromosome segregation ATPase
LPSEIKRNDSNFKGMEHERSLKELNENDSIRKGLNAEFLNGVDKKMNDQLKQQVHDLLGKLENVYTINLQLEYRASRAENNLKALQEVIDKRNKEFQELDEFKNLMEENQKNLNEALSNARLEISRLKNELNNEFERSENYYKLYIESLKEKEQSQQNSYPYSDPFNNLLGNPYQQQQVEYNNMIPIQTSLPEHPMIINIKEEFNEKMKLNENQINKLLAEITDLKKKLNNEEGNRTKQSDLVKNKNEKIEILLSELKKYKEILTDCANEVKWSQDKVVQKDLQIKVLKEKLTRKENELSSITKLLEKYRSKGKIVEEEPVIEKKKPQLFGPETPGDNF